MSALGQKQTFAMQKSMSALPPKADMCSATRHVRYVPIADIAHGKGAVDAAPVQFTKPWLLWSHHCGQILQMTPVPGI